MGSFTDFLKKKKHQAGDVLDAITPDVITDNPVVQAGAKVGANIFAAPVYQGYQAVTDPGKYLRHGGPLGQPLSALQASGELLGAVPGPWQDNRQNVGNLMGGPANVNQAVVSAALPSGMLQSIEQGSLRPAGQMVVGIPGALQNLGSAFAQGGSNALNAAAPKTWIPNVLDATGNLVKDPSLGTALQFGEALAAPSLELANTPLNAMHTEQGEGAFYTATHHGDIRDVDAASPFNYAVNWAREHPEEWPNIQQVYEHGYDKDGDGIMEFGPGSRAVWEYYIGKQARSTRIATDITNDPWNLGLFAGGAESVLGRGAEALGERAPALARGLEASGNLIGRSERGLQAVMDLPYVGPLKAARAAVRQIPGEAGLEAAILKGSKGWRAGITGDTAVTHLDRGEELVGSQTAVPAWATLQPPTGKYETVEAGRGQNYVVDPEGKPVPVSVQTGSGGKKKARKAAESWNNPRDGVVPPRGVTPDTASAATVPNPPEQTTITGREGIDQGTVDRNVPTSPIGSYQAAVNGVGTTSDFPTTGPVTRAELEQGWVPGKEDFPPGGTTPFDYQQTQPQRREAVNQGMTWHAPNVGDARLSTLVEQQRATQPAAAATYAQLVGFDHATGQAIPGSPLALHEDRVSKIPFWGDHEGGFPAKAADQRLMSSEFTIKTEAPAYQQAFGKGYRPAIPGNSTGDISPMVKLLHSGKTNDEANGLAQLLGRYVFGTDADADKVGGILSDYLADHAWFQTRAEQAQNLRDILTARWDMNVPQRNPMDIAPVEPNAVVQNMAGEPVPPAPVYPMPENIGLMDRSRRPAPAAPSTASSPRGFTTAKGSTYQITDRGTTIRDKAPRPEHPGIKERGIQPESERTVYADPADKIKMGAFQNPGTKMQMVVSDDGTQAAFKFLDGPYAGKLDQHNVFNVTTTPEVGKIPIELWDGGNTVHFGNEITSVNTVAPATPEAQNMRMPGQRRNPRDIKPGTPYDEEPPIEPTAPEPPPTPPAGPAPAETAPERVPILEPHQATVPEPMPNGGTRHYNNKQEIVYTAPNGREYTIKGKGKSHDVATEGEFLTLHGAPEDVATDLSHFYGPEYEPGGGQFGESKVDLGDGFTAKANRNRKSAQAIKTNPIWRVEDPNGNIIDDHRTLEGAQRQKTKGRYVAQEATAVSEPSPEAVAPAATEQADTASRREDVLRAGEDSGIAPPETAVEQAAPSDNAPSPTITAHPPETAKAVTALQGRTGDTGVTIVPTDSISTDPARFQPREGVNATKVENIMEGYDPQRLDPLVVWHDPADGKVYVLAGHHRIDALRQLGEVEAPVREFRGTEQEAINYAHTSNNQSPQSPLEQAGVARRLRAEGQGWKQIRQAMNLSSEDMARKYVYAAYAPQTIKEHMRVPVDQGGASLNTVAAFGAPIAEGKASVDEMARLFDFFHTRDGKMPTADQVDHFMQVAEVRQQAIDRGEIDPYAEAKPQTLFEMAGLDGGGVIGDAIAEIERMGGNKKQLLTQRSQLIGARNKGAKTGVQVAEADALASEIEAKLETLQKEIEGYSVRNAFGAAPTPPPVVDTALGKAYELPNLPPPELTLNTQVIPEPTAPELTPEQIRQQQKEAGQTDMFGITSRPMPAAQQFWNDISGGPAAPLKVPEPTLGDSILDQAVRGDLPNIVIDAEQAAGLRTVYPGMQKPLLDEFIDRLSYGMDPLDARNDIRKTIVNTMNPRRELSKKRAIRIPQKTWRALVSISDAARQNMMYGMLNAFSGLFGDFSGNYMQLQQTGNIRAITKANQTARFIFGKEPQHAVASAYSKEFDPVLNAWGRDMPEVVMPRSGQPVTMKTGFSDDNLVVHDWANTLAGWAGMKELPGPLKGPLNVIASPASRARRQAGDLNPRGALFTTVLDDQADAEVKRLGALMTEMGIPADDTIAAIRERAKMRAPGAGKGVTPIAFSPEDVLAVTKNKKLTQAWAEARNRAYKNAQDETRRVLFAGAKRYTADDILSHVFFFHFWQTRSLALQARSMIRNPRVMGQYYRMVQGAMNEADEKGYPATFRGLTHYWGDTNAGFYGLFNPLGVIVPAMMFGDLANSRQDAGAWEKISSILPVAPMLTGALGVLGLTDQTPNLLGTARVENVVADVMSWGNAHGFNFMEGVTGGGPQESPVTAMTRKVIESLNWMVHKAGGQRFEPYVSTTGKTDTIRAVVLHNAEHDYGPMEGWSPETMAHVQDALLSVDVGGAGNPDAERAYRDWADANIRNRLASFVLPQGSVLRYGPREADRNLAKTDDPGADMAQVRNNLRVASNDALPLQVAAFQENNQLGTPRQEQLYKEYNAITSGRVYDGQDQTWTIAGYPVTLSQLQGLPYEDRKLFAQKYIDERGGTAELEAYFTARSNFEQSNPSLSTYRQYKDTVSSFEGGAGAFRQWAREVSDEFKRREAVERARKRSQGSTGAALEAEMDGWARSQNAYLAFRNKRNSIYDPKPVGGPDDPVTTMQLIQQLNGGNSPYTNKPKAPSGFSSSVQGRTPWR